MKIDPVETFVAVIALPQRRFIFVGVVQVLNKPAQPIVTWLLEKMPVETLIMIPFPPLAELAAHEQQLLARMSVHPGIKHPQIGELLPVITRHLANHRTLSMHYFIMAKHEDEVFVERIQ